MFFFYFWVALGAPWDGLTCNPYAPAQSKHTFSFLHFFSKIVSKRPHRGSILGAIFLQNCNFEWNNLLQKLLQKKVPRQTQTRLYSQAGGPVERQPRVRVFCTRNNYLGNCSSTFRNCWKKWTGCGKNAKTVIGLLKKCKESEPIAEKCKRKNTYICHCLLQKLLIYVRFAFQKKTSAGDLTRLRPRPGEFILRL